MDLGFLNKLKSDIDNSLTKMEGKLGTKLVYIIVHFDDFTLMFFSTYKKQIINFMECNYSDLEVHIRIGLESGKTIHYKPQA